MLVASVCVGVLRVASHLLRDVPSGVLRQIHTSSWECVCVAVWSYYIKFFSFFFFMFTLCVCVCVCLLCCCSFPTVFAQSIKTEGRGLTHARQPAPVPLPPSANFFFRLVQSIKKETFFQVFFLFNLAISLMTLGPSLLKSNSCCCCCCCHSA